jgi:hypothetical protein
MTLRYRVGRTPAMLCIRPAQPADLDPSFSWTAEPRT